MLKKLIEIAQQTVFKRTFTFVVLVFSIGSSYAIQHSSTKTDTTYLKEIVELLQQKWPKNRTVNLVFHGHSVPSGYLNTPIITTFDAYPMLVLKNITETYKTAMVNVIRTSIGGENAEQGEKRFKTEVLNHKPDVVFIDYALNDRRNGLEKSKIAWESMIKQAIEAKIKVILLTPTPDLNEVIKDENTPLALHSNQIRLLAKQYNIPVIDSYLCFQNMANNGVDLKSVMAQNNHINEKGHGIVADLISALFKLK
jgi:lysophospholipase L1-like esterase